jgi:hypothetical protein
MRGWSRLSSPVLVFIPTLVLSRKVTPYPGWDPQHGLFKLSFFFRPWAARLLDQWLLATSYGYGYSLLTIGNCLLAIENWVLVMATDY